MDYYENPPEGGDNTFFYGHHREQQLHERRDLLYMAKSTMLDFVQEDVHRKIKDFGGAGYGFNAAAGTAGCNSNYLNNLSYFMNGTVLTPNATTAGISTASQADLYCWNNVSRPRPHLFPGGSGQSDGLSSTAIYLYRAWGAPSVATTNVGTSAATACSTLETSLTAAGASRGTALQWTTFMRQLHELPLGTNGYFLTPSTVTTAAGAQVVPDNSTSPTVGLFKGNWLRFYPPKWTMLSLAYKRLVNGPLLSGSRFAKHA